jgi:hypothetical protein
MAIGGGVPRGSVDSIWGLEMIEGKVVLDDLCARVSGGPGATGIESKGVVAVVVVAAIKLS